MLIWGMIVRIFEPNLLRKIYDAFTRGDVAAWRMQNQVQSSVKVETGKRRHEAVLVLIIYLRAEKVLWAWPLQESRIINDDVPARQF
jgi:hypothetical protein